MFKKENLMSPWKLYQTYDQNFCLRTKISYIKNISMFREIRLIFTCFTVQTIFFIWIVSNFNNGTTKSTKSMKIGTLVQKLWLTNHWIYINVSSNCITFLFLKSVKIKKIFFWFFALRNSHEIKREYIDFIYYTKCIKKNIIKNLFSLT